MYFALLKSSITPRSFLKIGSCANLILAWPLIKLNVHYILQLLKHRGFPKKWILWIENLLLFFKLLLLMVNLDNWIHCTCKVRQGYPLSLSLFILTVDNLAKLLNNAASSNIYHGLEMLACRII